MASQVTIDQVPLPASDDMMLEGTALIPDDIVLLTEGGEAVSPLVTALDVDKARGLIQAYRTQILLLQFGHLDPEKGTVNQLTNPVPRAEAIDPGRFRCDSHVVGGGHVRLSTGAWSAGSTAASWVSPAAPWLSTYCQP